MADLDALRPEVRRAIESLDVRADEDWTEYHVIRAELLRLAEGNNGLQEYVHAHGVAIIRVEKAESELAAAQNTIAAQQGTMGALKRKLALVEGELAALKARIAEAPEVRMSGLRILTDSEEDARSAMAAWCARTKRVRLVVEE